MKLLSPLYIEPNPLLRTFFESDYFTCVYDGSSYELPGDAYRPARKLRLFTFDGMDGVGKSIQAGRLYRDLFKCGFPAHQVDDSFGYVYERENRVVLRKQANRGNRAATFIHINQVMMARSHTLLFNLWPWMLYPVAMVTERSFLSTVVMHLFDKVVSGKVAPNPRAWETYILGGDRNLSGARHPGGVVQHALRGNVFFADVAFILLGSVRFAVAQCAERAKNKGRPVPVHETMDGLRLLRRLYLWIAGGVPNARVLEVRTQRSFRYLYATVWNRTARARQELARQLTPQDSAIAVRRSQKQRWVRNEALRVG